MRQGQCSRLRSVELPHVPRARQGIDMMVLRLAVGLTVLEPPVAGEHQPFGHQLELEVYGRPGILRRRLAGVGQPVPADGDVRRHDHVRGAEQAALAK